MPLEDIGWNEFFAGQHSAGIPARVASVFYERFLVWTEAGEIDVGVSGTLRRTSPIWPTVGDWVVLREDADVIVKVLERKTKLCRKQPDREIREQVLAANVDVLFIVSGLDRDYNERRLERYLVVAKQSGARPVVLLNKSDLADGNGMDIADVIRKTQQMDLEVPVVALSALCDEALDVIPTFLSNGETAALLGSSGVGKSTILNQTDWRRAAAYAGNEGKRQSRAAHDHQPRDVPDAGRMAVDRSSGTSRGAALGVPGNSCRELRRYPGAG